MRRIALIVVFGLATTGWPPASGASEPASVILERAERARSADPAEFRQLLGELNRLGAKATPLQRDQIAYLNAYALSFEGDLDGGIRSAQKLISTTRDTDLKFRAGALIVNNYALNGRYNEGLRQLEETLTLLDHVKDLTLREHGLISASTLYNQIG